MKESFSSRLKKAMLDKQMKQIDIINKSKLLSDNGAKITKTDLSQYVNGKTSPGQKKLYVLSKVLDVSEAWLLGYDVSSERPTDEERHLNQNEQIIAAHIKDDVTDEEMKEIVNFIEYIKSKRNTNSNSDK
ncbi:TPA: helix-turn-helix domain-containing protein [Staphylococcus aureus Sa_TPS3184]|uniref:helix-turn-helix domain-containing protein n=1 Tax=Staphylococcus aureus TaxID=1280 RepID=UPI00215C5926|nr:helix-turn-helix domain-containing protein [Staphylococcus aureus]HDJ7036843.1 helix-turn-helix domain-containing protein [Staphylococcus aureus Sa_TPS3184]HDJ7146904.1 helix-turn-helix domain-containing protein [Staphylococcus aureus Sa_TPS3187]UVJ24675.1 helix-turn-helix domain-containing protein [Staphylococcus aureus]HDB8135157.1 helix-turn-helix domain-containing protein [Staphylococcus aureus]HDB8893178.1 helix-turn-helix domain-containing protein [Staphylococcus aureus]